MLVLLSAIFLGYGMYQILYKSLKLPDETMEKLKKRFQNEVKKSFLSNFEDKIYYKIKNYIKFDDIKKNRLNKVFLLANIRETPEEYYAEKIASLLVKSILIISIVIPISIISNLTFFIFIGLGLIGYESLKFIKQIKSPYKEIEKNRLEIERQMYPFVINISQELLIDTDVIRILDNFKGRSSGILKKHLEITLSEARVSNVINALIRMESRINSTMVSDVVRGLISLSRGENNREYFLMLTSSFKGIYINQKRKEASLLPSKILKYTFIVVGALIVLIIGGMIPLIFESTKSMIL